MAFIEYRPTRELNHYTTISGFIGILESKTLWASDLTSSNDPREIEIGKELLTKILMDLSSSAIDENKKQIIEQLARRMIEAYATQRLYSIALTFCDDDLPMWGNYGGSYSGICISFRRSAIESMHGRLQKVEYANSPIESTLRRSVTETIESLESCENPADLYNLLLASSFALSKLTSIKHPTWSYEREIRLTYAQAPRELKPTSLWDFGATTMTPDKKMVRWTEPKTRSGKTSPIDYLALPFGKFRAGQFEPSGSIAGVVLGPNCPISEDEANELLSRNGFRDFIVKQSECKIRA